MSSIQLELDDCNDIQYTLAVVRVIVILKKDEALKIIIHFDGEQTIVFHTRIRATG